MAYTTIDDPEAYFQVKLYTGDGSTPSITLDGGTDMQPDFVWIKNRDAADFNCIFDSVRGAGNLIYSNFNGTGFVTDADTLTSFDSDGFALGADVKVNTNTEAYVAWCWKESATSGFDIVTYTGTGSARNISHALSAVPHLVIVKADEGQSINVYHHKNTSEPETDLLELDEKNPTADNATVWDDTAPTSSVFTVGTKDSVNKDGIDMIMYLWSGKQGFSKFGGYVGNGNADGTFVYTGFRPAYILIKNNTAGEKWEIFDNKRDGYNDANRILYTDTADAEPAASDRIRFCANGFKAVTTGSHVNESGSTIIYAAFAEAPFVNSNGVPCNAR